MSVKKGISKKITVEREKLSKYAFGIVIALCVQILVYLCVINIVPFSNEKPDMIMSENQKYSFALLDGENYYGAEFFEDGKYEFIESEGNPVIFKYKDVINFCENVGAVPLIEKYTVEDVNPLYMEIWPTYYGVDKNNDGDISYVEREYNPKQGQLLKFSKNIQIDNGMQFIYGYNMILLIASFVLAVWYFITILEEHEGNVWQNIKLFFKKNKGLFILLIFMIWVFIGSLLAYDVHRSFVGCYNLRDGYFSFMFYASMLVCMLIMGNNKKYKKIIINTFLITATILCLLTIFDYTEISTDGVNRFINVKQHSNGLTLSNDGKDYLVYKYEPNVMAVLSGIFNNTNHYAYYLTIALIVATVMAVKEENIIYKILYVLSFVLMTYMLIINNTFGSYIGVMLALIAFYVYVILKAFIDVSEEKLKCVYEIVTAAVIIISFVVASSVIVNYKGESIVGKNLTELQTGIGSIMKSMSNSKTDKNKEIDSIEVENQNISNEIESEKLPAENNEVSVSDVGSGRWGIWLDAVKVIKKFPIFGCGLENMLYRMGDIPETERDASDIEGRAHNLVIQLAATTGIPGMLFYFTGMLFIFFTAVKNIKNWDVYSCVGVFVIVAYMISSMTGNSGFYTSGYFYIFVGMVALESFMNIEQKNVEAGKMSNIDVSHFHTMGVAEKPKKNSSKPNKNGKSI